MFDSTVTIDTKELAAAISLLSANNLKQENIKSVKDSEGIVHIIQMGLFSHTNPCNQGGVMYTSNQTHTKINFINDQSIVIALNTEQTAIALGITPTTMKTEN